jgi:hypothetical protein
VFRIEYAHDSERSIQNSVTSWVGDKTRCVDELNDWSLCRSDDRRCSRAEEVLVHHCSSDMTIPAVIIVWLDRRSFMSSVGVV